MVDSFLATGEHHPVSTQILRPYVSRTVGLVLGFLDVSRDPVVTPGTERSSAPRCDKLYRIGNTLHRPKLPTRKLLPEPVVCRLHGARFAELPDRETFLDLTLLDRRLLGETPLHFCPDNHIRSYQNLFFKQTLVEAGTFLFPTDRGCRILFTGARSFLGSQPCATFMVALRVEDLVEEVAERTPPAPLPVAGAPAP